MKKMVLCAMGLVSTVFAIDWKSAVDGNFADPAMWSSGSVPGAGALADIQKAGSYTVTLPTGAFTDSTALRLNYNRLDGVNIAIDFPETQWYKFSEAAFTGNLPFQTGGGAHTFNIESVKVGSPQFYATNGLYRYSHAANVTSNVFVRGGWNFYDPQGVRSTNSIVVGHSTYGPTHVVLGADSQTRWSVFNFRGYYSGLPAHSLRFLGGRHEFVQDLNVGHTHDSSAKFRRFYEVDVSGGAQVTVMGGMNLPASRTNTLNMVIRDGALWNTRGYVNIGNGAESSGTLTIDGGVFSNTASTVNIAVADAATGIVNLVSGEFRSMNQSVSLATISNSTARINQSGGLFFTRDMSSAKGSAVYDLTGGVLTNSSTGDSMYWGSDAGSDGLVLLRGGAMNWLGNVFLGVNAGAYGRFSVSNGTHTIAGSIQTGYKGDGLLDLAGGSLTVSGDTRIGSGNLPTGRGRMVVSGGTHVLRNSVIAGYSAGCPGSIEVNGGAFSTVGTIWAGYQTGTFGSFVQTAGSVSAGTFTVANSSGSTGTVALTGGTLGVSSLLAGVGGTGVVTVADSAALTATGISRVGIDPGSYGELRITGGATAFNELTAAYRVGALGRIYIQGGVNAIGTLSTGWSGSTDTPAGDGIVEITAGSSSIERLNAGYSCVAERGLVRITGGVNAISPTRRGEGISIAQNGVLEVSGGFTTVNDYIRLNNSSNQGGFTNRLVITGGTLDLTNGVVNLADQGGAAGQSELILDGGELRASIVRGWTYAQSRGGNIRTVLSADGGILRTKPNSNLSVLLEKIDYAELGPGGLLVDTPYVGYTKYMDQVFADKPGTSGRFIKTGIGELVIRAAGTYSETIAAGGTLTIGTGGGFGRGLVVTNGALVRGIGSTSCSRFVLGDAQTPGTLGEFDNAATIAVTEPGGLSLGYGIINLTAPGQDGVYTLFTCPGEHSENLWGHTIVGNMNSGKWYSFSQKYDSGTETTALTLTISSEPPESAVSQTWTGAESSAWNTPANWDSALPGLYDTALFGSAGLLKTLDTGLGATAGILVFASDEPYALGGTGPLAVNISIGSQKATNTISAPLTLPSNASVDASEGAGLVVSGNIASGGIVKSGKGLLRLDGVNALSTLTVLDGLLEVGRPQAFGFSSQSPSQLMVGPATVRYSGAAGETGGGFTVNPGSDTAVSVFDVRGDLTVNGYAAASAGAFIKHGEGGLTLNLSDGASTINNGYGRSSENNPPSGAMMSFSEDGTVPATGYAGFTVAQGPMTVRGSQSAVFNARFPVMIGGNNLLPGTADAVFTVDGCRAFLGDSGKHLYIGGVTRSGSLLTNSALRIVNGGYVWANTVKHGTSASAKIRPLLFMDNGSLEVSYSFHTSDNENALAALDLRNNSQITTREFLFKRITDATIDGSTLYTTDSQIPFTFQDGAGGRLTLRNGGRIRTMGLLYKDAGSGIALTLDGGTLEFRGNWSEIPKHENLQTVTLSGAGGTYEITGTARYDMAHPIDGDGPLYKTGSGELVFGPGRGDLGGSTNFTGKVVGRYTGRTYVQAGTLSVSNGTIQTEAKVTVSAGAVLNLTGGDDVVLGELAGSGTVRNGTLTAVLKLAGTPAAIQDLLAFEDVAVRKLTVDFGRTSETALAAGEEIAVARISGASASAAGWRGTGTGGNVNTEFSIRDGVVYALVKDGGTRIILR